MSHRDGSQTVTSAEVHCSKGSSDEDEYEQAVTVGGRCEKLDAAIQCNDTVGGGSATVYLAGTHLLHDSVLVCKCVILGLCMNGNILSLYYVSRNQT